MATSFVIPASYGAALRNKKTGVTVPIVAWGVTRVVDGEPWTAVPVTEITLPPGYELVEPAAVADDERAGAA